MRLPLVSAGLLLMLALPAKAQTEIKVPAAAGWKHAQTGMIFRSKLAGIPRTEIKDGSDTELDVSIHYSDTDTTLTIFLFRPALANVAVWFDRSETQIALGDLFGGVSPFADIRAFAPPQGTIASAMRRIYVPGKREIKSTALAVLPLGEWLLKIWMTSNGLDPAELDAKLDEVVKAIGWPADATESVAAVPLPICTGQLAYARKAKLRKPSLTDALLGATLMGVAADKAAKGEKGTPIDWCREGQANQQYGVYRDKGSRDAYTLPMGDAGRTISVSPGIALDGGNGGYMLTLGQLDRTLVYPSFDRLPAPDTAFQAVFKTAPVSSSARGGKDITIDAPE